MTSETEEDNQKPDTRDAALMRRLALARSRPDGALRAELILSELLALHEPNIRRVVRYGTYSRRPSAADIDEIINTVMIRVAKALAGDFDPRVPFGALVAKNASWAVKDWYRARKRHDIEVSLDAMEQLAAPEADDGPSLVDEAAALHKEIAELPDRDQQILGLRLFTGLDPKRIAAHLGMSRGAVDTATTRALKRLDAMDAVEAPDNVDGVRDSDQPSVEGS